VLAAALTAIMIAAFGAFGGLSYAASAVATAAKNVNPVHIVTQRVAVRRTPATSKASETRQPKRAVVWRSPAQIALFASDNVDPAEDQYKPGRGCGDQNHVHAQENTCKKLK
jgi:hypothetical protein